MSAWERTGFALLFAAVVALLLLMLREVYRGQVCADKCFPLRQRVMLDGRCLCEGAPVKPPNRR